MVTGARTSPNTAATFRDRLVNCASPGVGSPRPNERPSPRPPFPDSGAAWAAGAENAMAPATANAANMLFMCIAKPPDPPHPIRSA